jgi:glycosyltransferase involved in cell wall biosynthesis
VNVLLLTQVLPFPPDSGPKVKTYNVIKFLAKRHSVTLVSFVRGDQSEHVRQLEQYCQAVHTVPIARSTILDGMAMLRSLLSRQPWMMVRDDRRAMRDLVDSLAAEQVYDIAHADQLNMGQFAERVPSTFKVLDAHNALWLLYKRLWETMQPGLRKWLLGRDWRLLKEYEGQMARKFDAVLAVSQQDQAALLEAAGAERKITVIPIAIDTDEADLVVREPGANHILHLGTMYWPPNIDGVMWFLREVFPHIRQHFPKAVFDVVGSRPPLILQELGRADSGIDVAGYVEDVTPFLKQAGVFVVPLRAGGGMRVKILNALAEGIPIVSTKLGCEGIDVTDGEDILIADKPGDFAAAVLRLLDDPELGQRLSRNGRRLVEERYDYRTACLPLDAVYEESNRVVRDRSRGSE